MNKFPYSGVQYDFIGSKDTHVACNMENEIKDDPHAVAETSFRFAPVNATVNMHANLESVECGTDKENVSFCAKYGLKRRLVKVTYIVLYVLYIIYVGFAISYDASGAIFICIFGIVLFFVLLVKVFRIKDRKCCSNILKSRFKHSTGCIKQRSRLILRWTLTTLACVGLVVFLIVDIISDAEKLKPLGGLFLFLFLLWTTSTSPLKVKWIPVITGLLMQFILGILILRWPPGYAACKFLGDSVTVFLSYTDAGSKFVFGDPGYTLHAVAFQILPVVVFFSAVVSILYYLGILQFVIKVIAKTLEFLMQTTPMESFATAAHIFIGQVESSVALKPFLSNMTDSELNAVMTSGFATVAGTVIAAYVEFGVPAEHVISASFMSAPAALAVAKLNYPEQKDIESKSEEEIELDVGNESNIMEAAAVGATYAVKLVAYVVVNIIAFLAILAFLDAAIAYFASKVGFFTVDFEYVISYLFMPLAVIMGVPWEEAQTVGKLIAKKILANEFLAYADLGKYITSGELQVRTIVISTYILCGFGSSAAMGINLGALSAAEPKKRSAFAKLLSRAFIEGNIACFMTACIAGILYQDNDLLLTTSQNLTVTNGTSNFTVTANFTTVLPHILNVTVG